MAALPIDAFAQQVAPDRLPLPGPGLLVAEELGGAVQRHPAHHPALNLATLPASDLPEAAVGLAPAPSHDVGEFGQERLMPDGDACAAHGVQDVGALEQLAIDIDLPLTISVVAGPNGAAVPVAGEMVHDLLRQRGPAVDPIHDLKLGPGPLVAAAQELEIAHRLSTVAEREKRVEREARIPHPGDAVVPVAPPPIASGREVVGAATTAPVGA